MRLTIVTLVSFALLVAAALPTATAVSARPKCDGKFATIVGTNRGETIRGTNGPDVILAKGGRDKIYGRGGRDRICGGGGRDDIFGGRGNDRLFGGGALDFIKGGGGKDDIFGGRGNDILNGGIGKDFIKGGGGIDTIGGKAGDDILKGGPGDDTILGQDGDDTLRGQGGNDDLDGGPDLDLCLQGPGSGMIENCEGGTADLGVDVSSPGSTAEGIVPFTITVTNNGPDDVAYVLSLKNDNSSATCSGGVETGNYIKPVLESGKNRQLLSSPDCEIEGADAKVSTEVLVSPFGDDPNLANNEDKSTTNLTP